MRESEPSEPAEEAVRSANQAARDPGEAPALYHDLQCLSGFGDRLLDLWAALTVARLLEPDGRLAVRWEAGGEFMGFTGIYSTELFRIQGCRFVDELPRGAVALEKRFSHTDLNERGLLRLAGGARQIVLRRGKIWGTSSPETLHAELAFHGLDVALPLHRIVEAYCAAARHTEPSAEILEGIPADIDGRVGIHVRLKDKLVANELSFDMNLETWQSIEQQAMLILQRWIARGLPLFVCSDDPVYKGQLVEALRSHGGDVAVAAPPAEHLHRPGFAALVDFFALARSARVLQVTKYSTFSMAASLVGGVPLVNLYSGESSTGHRLDLWKSVLDLQPPERS